MIIKPRGGADKQASRRGHRAMKVTVKDMMRHYLNPLHVYCSLTYLFRKEKALRTARKYERRIYKLFVNAFFL
ncbi:MAG TPA: hypothetical protein ENI77_08885 [Nitrospirae bacterium]|nr:hypothetical protein [Nitrospirota bacterium]